MNRKEPGHSGILLVDKPAGWTSHDVVARCRRLVGERRIGHTGTLDPAATGLLVLCVGHATRFVEEMTAHDKRYTGVITLGTATDTDDATGTVIASRPVPPLQPADLQRLESQFTGVLHQKPPAYSAVQSGGQRAYAAARAGTPLDLAPREVTVHALTVRRSRPVTLDIAVHCGPGVYIRSLARDIGETIGCGAHLSALRRESVGEFAVAEAWTLDELAALAGAGNAAAALLEIDEGLTALDAAILDDEHIADILHGRRVPSGDAAGPPAAGPVRVYSAAGGMVALAARDPDGLLRPRKVLARPD